MLLRGGGGGEGGKGKVRFRFPWRHLSILLFITGEPQKLGRQN